MELIVLENGPIIIRNGEKKQALCRCGQSTNQPFCTGTHAEIGFEAPAVEIEYAEEKDQPNLRCSC